MIIKLNSGKTDGLDYGSFLVQAAGNVSSWFYSKTIFDIFLTSSIKN